MTPEEIQASEFLLFLNRHHHKYYDSYIDYNIDPKWEDGLYDEEYYINPIVR